MELKNKEINSLVEHIQLNKSGWLQEGLKCIIKQIYGKRGNPALSIEEIKEIFKRYDEISVRTHEIEKVYNTLISSNILIKVEKYKYKLSENSYNKFMEENETFELIEKETKKFFIIILEKVLHNNINKDKLWNDFIELLVQPLISKMGAKSFEIITGSSKEIEYDDNNNDYFKKHYGIDQELHQVIADFLTNKNSFVRKYLLNLLKTYYFIEATRLPASDLNKIYELSKVQSKLKIFIDTNFLLSLFDLHDNPSNEAAKSLTNLLDEIKNKISVKFYVLLITIKEFQNLIENYKDYLRKKPLSLSNARILIDRDEISGIPKKYYQKCIEIDKLIDVDDYFDPYINNLIVISRNNNIELQNEKLDKYQQTNNMSVNDDIIAQVEYRINKYKKAKNGKIDKNELEQIKENIARRFKHDCILWHAINDKRPQYIDSIKDIKNWILTLDFHFLSYDRYKTNSLQKKISLCLHPNDLISLLYFWVPRSEKFEKAVLENFRLPFSFKDFDKKAEQVSVAILSALSYYENADLDKKTITELLTNQALRNKIKTDSSIEENAKIIKDEIFERYKLKQTELEEKNSENQEIKKELNKIKNKMSILEKKDLYQEIKKGKESISEKITDKSKYLTKLINLKDKAEEEYEIESKKFINIFKNKIKLEKEILNRYPSFDEIDDIGEEIKNLENRLDSLQFNIGTTTVFFCENRNAKCFNNLGFENIRFLGEKDSRGVFIKVATNSNYFGIRDRDFLTDDEILRLKQKLPDYIILEYYCFENYLYHPDNIESLKIEGFNKEKYVDEIKKQMKEQRDSIVLKLKNSRKSYQEFITDENGIIPDKNGEKIIIKYLDSDNIENNLKAYSLKEFNKSFLEKFNLSPLQLTKTKWFINRIKKLIDT